MSCPKCQATVPEGARFCESCGAGLLPPAASSAGRCRCGAGPEAKDEAGYCSVCGLRWQTPPAREPLPRDHVETAPTPCFAAVTDRGKRHSCNEDDVALAREDGPETTVVVVCDGVSSSQHAEDASAAAAQTACASLLAAARQADLDPPAAMRAAIRKAHEAASSLPSLPDPPKGPPGTTLVAALVREGVATLGWVGDSRAYWIGADAARLLTRDHSWVNEVVDAGEMAEEEALRSPEAHAITRCLGRLNGDGPEDAPEPSVRSVSLDTPGWLLLCSDGLWNYAPQADQLAAMIRPPSPDGDADALDLCRRLVDYALARGGRDNITVALLRVV
jgi:serine/threonine protein phosphatase PrpC